MKDYACGICGCHCLEDGYHIVPIPDNYDPNQCELTYCWECIKEEICHREMEYLEAWEENES